MYTVMFSGGYIVYILPSATLEDSFDGNSGMHITFISSSSPLTSLSLSLSHSLSERDYL